MNGEAVAISFMDVADFSEYTAAEGDEAAVELLDNFLDVAELFVRGARGRVVKRLGDGLMAAYHGPAEAVRASVAIQQALAARAAANPGHAATKARIGVHYGHPVERGGDLFGYDVNLTARLVEAAQPGQVLVTEAVKEAVSPHLPGIRLRAVGKLIAKGVSDAVRVYEAMPASGTRDDVPQPMALPEGWVLSVDEFDLKAGEAADLLQFARDSEAAVIGLGGRSIFLGLATGGEGIGPRHQMVSVVAFPSMEAWEAYVSDPELEHLNVDRQKALTNEELTAYTPITTFRQVPFAPFPAAVESHEKELPELPAVPFLDLIRAARRPGRGRAR